ncbi:MAG: substrate-binding domain-containing protein [Deltaproteobacteria bacterium]|nr:substrate-binding domain-containing protein [Deltaproteobacteria bacterium]
MFIPSIKSEFLVALIWTAILVLAGSAYGKVSRSIKMSTTTSTENSGLLDVLLPAFTRDTGIRVKVFAKGTGAALRDGMHGNVDIILVHAKEEEERFVAQGYGAYRLGVMHNDFVIVGPGVDPAGIRGTSDAISALKKIYNAKALFVSRGDDSGTHKKEQALWKVTGVPLNRQVRQIIIKGKTRKLIYLYPAGLGTWYMSIGQGMGKTLTYAEEKRAYTISDRGTYLKYKFGRQRGLDLDILCEGDPLLYNPYGIIPINPKVHPHVKFEWADALARWMVSRKAQELIASFKIMGRQAFFPDALGGTK